MRNGSIFSTVALALVGLVLGVSVRAGAAPAGATVLCGPDYGYGCVSGTGYSGQDVWGTRYPGHNCVNYAAYRLSKNGAAKPWSGRVGNAHEWDDFARRVGIPVDGNPVVGSIAGWEGRTPYAPGSLGHVAYVEVVAPTYIEITEDNYMSNGRGYTRRMRIGRGTASWPSSFIHIKDQASTTEQRATDLVFVKTKNVGNASGRVELHALTAASSFQSFAFNLVTGLGSGDADNGWFQVGPR
jgi:surface antigen